MKNLTPKAIALRLSFIVATTFTTIVFLSEYFSESIHFLSIFLVFSSSLVISYIGFLIAIEQFIYNELLSAPCQMSTKKQLVILDFSVSVKILMAQR